MPVQRTPGEWNHAVRQQAALAHLGQIGLQSRDLEQVLSSALEVTAEALGVADVALFELLAERRVLRGRASIHQGRLVRRSRMRQLEVPLGPGSLPGFAVDRDGPVVADDLLADARFRAAAPDHGLSLRSAVAAPIGWEGRPWGVLAVYDVEVRAWSEDDVRFVAAVATTMGLAIQRARIERELGDRTARLDLSLSAGGLGAWSWHLRTGEVVLNSVALALHGHQESTFEGTGEEFAAVIHPEDRDRVRDASAEAIERRHDLHHSYRVVRPDNGEVRWIESWARLLESPLSDPQLVGVCADVTDRRRGDELRDAILASEHAARLEAETAKERLSFLAGASSVLTESLEPEVIVARLAELCVPALGDACFVEVIDDDGGLREAVAHAVDSQAVEAARRLRAEAGPATMSAGLVTRGRSMGTLTVVRVRPDAPPPSAEDRAVVVDLAARAALAFDNGRLFHSRNRVARSLQAALLPPTLPEIDGLHLAARYDVAETDVAIGGDFYDVFPTGPSSWGVVVGDVCGRGPDAAALTGLVRHSLRSAVVGEDVPSRILRQTNAAVVQQIDEARFCTAAFVRIDLDPAGRDGVDVLASSAGHPRPVVVRAGGGAQPVECSGTLLGVVDDPDLVDVAIHLDPGDALVLYTDGVTEARQGAELFGEDRLLEVLATAPSLDAEDLADAIEAAVAGFRGSARDDTAIVVVRAAARP